MSYDWLTVECLLGGVQPPPRHTLYTVNGTGVTMWDGYPADLARAVSDEQWVWQPVAYPGTAIPMQPSINSGDSEFARLLRLRPPSNTWGFIGYSQGAIITSDIMDRCGITHNPAVATDLAEYAASFIGGVTFGNPRREQTHTVPNGIDPGGHGIVTPNLVNTPASVYDMAAGKHMVGSPGQDLYTTAGYNGDANSTADEEAVWAIIDKGSISSFLPLLTQIIKLLKGNILQGGIEAGIAIFDALDFFVVKGLTPHTSYQYTQPIAGDGRDCWRIALDYLNYLGSQVSAHA